MNETVGKQNQADSGLHPALDKIPNLTLLETGQNPGAILKASREKAGYSLSDISAKTKINERQLEALESGDPSRLPQETFARAFIKSYCKALSIDHLPVLAAFGMSGQVSTPRATPLEGASRVEATETRMPENSRRLTSISFDGKGGNKTLIAGVSLGVAVLLAVFYLPAIVKQTIPGVAQTDQAFPPKGAEAELAVVPASSADAPVASGSSETAAVEAGIVFPALSAGSNAQANAEGGAQAPAAVGAASSAIGASAGLASTGVAAAVPGNTVNSGVVPSGAVAANTAASSAASVAAPGAAAPVVATAAAKPTTNAGAGTAQATSPTTTTTVQTAVPGKTVTASTPTTATPSPSTASSSGVSLPAANTSAQASAKPAGTKESTLRFRFADESWVTIRDANDKVLVSQLNTPNSNLEVKGQPPFRLIVGNAKMVTVTNNGQGIDLNSSLKGDVARLTVE